MLFTQDGPLVLGSGIPFNFVGKCGRETHTHDPIMSEPLSPVSDGSEKHYRGDSFRDEKEAELELGPVDCRFLVNSKDRNQLNGDSDPFSGCHRRELFWITDVFALLSVARILGGHRGPVRRPQPRQVSSCRS